MLLLSLSWLLLLSGGSYVSISCQDHTGDAVAATIPYYLLADGVALDSLPVPDSARTHILQPVIYNAYSALPLLRELGVEQLQ